MLGRIAAEPGLLPFQKQLLDGSGTLRCAEVSWPVGDDAAARGIDLRYYTQGPGPSLGERATLVAAVRFGYRAGIGGEGFFLSAHGGAVESVFDETTAELVKASLGPLASTIEFSAKIKKPVPLHTSLRLECAITSVAGLRVNTSGRLLDGAGTELASCTAQLVDLGQLRAANGGGR